MLENLQQAIDCAKFTHGHLLHAAKGCSALEYMIFEDLLRDAAHMMQRIERLQRALLDAVDK